MSAVWRRAVAFSVLIHLPYVLSSSTSYQRGDTVPLYANKARYSFVRPSKTETWNSKSFGQVGPFANPSEQYEYYTLPFCAPKVCFSFCCIIREDFWSAKAGLNFSGWGTEKPAFGRGLGWRSDDENFIFSSVPGYLNYRISHNRFFPTAFHCSSIWGQKVVHIHAQAQWYWSIPEGNRWRVLFWIHLRYDILRSHLDLSALTTSLGQTTCQSGDSLARRKFSEETERKERTTIFSLTTSFLWLIMDKRWSGVSILLL